jgi:hypothetical protein
MAEVETEVAAAVIIRAMAEWYGLTLKKIWEILFAG